MIAMKTGNNQDGQFEIEEENVGKKHSLGRKKMSRSNVMSRDQDDASDMKKVIMESPITCSAKGAVEPP